MFLNSRIVWVIIINFRLIYMLSRSQTRSYQRTRTHSRSTYICSWSTFGDISAYQMVSANTSTMPLGGLLGPCVQICILQHQGYIEYFEKEWCVIGENVDDLMYEVWSFPYFLKCQSLDFFVSCCNLCHLFDLGLFRGTIPLMVWCPPSVFKRTNTIVQRSWSCGPISY